MSIQTIIAGLVREKKVFTDVQVRVGMPLMVRTPSGWEAFSADPLTRDDVESFVSVVAGPNWKKDMENSPSMALDVAKTIGGAARLRCNIAYSDATFTMEETGDEGGPQSDIEVLIRKLSLTPPEFKETGLPPEVLKNMLTQKGLWVISGSTGNGKSTTVASILNHVNKTQSKHIITIEQPIEYVLRPEKCIISQKEVGRMTTTFNQGLVAALRQRPDIIMIGEVRDADTMETMLQAAESGHLVLATLHTKNVEDALYKLTSFLHGRQDNKINTLASTLCGIVSQNLIPTVGAKNLTLAYEVLFNVPEIQQLIRKGEFQKLNNAMASNRKAGCVLLNDKLKDLVRNAVISKEVATDTAYDPEGFTKDLYL